MPIDLKSIVETLAVTSRSVRRIDARVKVPLNQWVVIGGMARGGEGGAGPMYLVVKVNASQQDEDDGN